MGHKMGIVTLSNFSRTELERGRDLLGKAEEKWSIIPILYFHNSL